jgi:meso-butanediol dehydrogenase / (S,S)-butanediol dehydrogenase / diacetyl reductase
MRLKDKVAVITGSTRGIGAETARHFADQGAKVIITGRSTDHGNAMMRELTATGARAEFIAADLAREEDVRQVMDFARSAFGALHILVNNAAPTELLLSGQDKPVFEQTSGEYESIIRAGQFSIFWSCKYAIPHMITAGGGAIVNISSIAGSQGAPSLPAYSSTKGAMDALTRQIAVDAGPFGIRCNTVIIGAVDSHGLSSTVEEDGTPNILGRRGRPMEAAQLIAFLASDEASFITAAAIPCDGGQLNRMTVRPHLPWRKS